MLQKPDRGLLRQIKSRELTKDEERRNLSMVDLQAGDGNLQRRGTCPTLQGLYISILKDIMGRGVGSRRIYTGMKSSKALQGMNDVISIKGGAN